MVKGSNSNPEVLGSNLDHCSAKRTKTIHAVSRKNYIPVIGSVLVKDVMKQRMVFYKESIVRNQDGEWIRREH